MKKMKKLVALLCAISMIIPGNAAFASNVNDTFQSDQAQTNAESESLLGAESGAERGLESQAKFASGNESESETKIESENKSESGTEAESESKTESGTEAESESKTESGTESDSESKTEPGTESETGSETESETESESESESETEPERDDEERENSWRFEDGVWLGSYGISTFAAVAPNAWTNVDGNYVNSNGDVISGAIARGIDVSEWQGEIDWEKVSSDDISFAIIRSGAGQTYNDKYWQYNTSECERLGIPYGTYLYSYAETPEDAVEEAEHLLNLVSGKDLNYPIYYDLEDNATLYETLEDGTQRLRSSAEIAAIAKAFCDKVSAAGYEVQIYANTYWWNNYLTDAYFSQFSNRWVAQYDAKCTYGGTYAMWQCTSSGRIDGISGNVDINMLYTDQYDKTFAVKRFVTRLYELVLNRKPDESGLKDWTTRLTSQFSTGAEVLSGFIHSDELIDKNLSNEDFVELLYQTCLNRASDSMGKRYWINYLKDGLSRNFVLRGFAESVEFTDICNSYGIRRGNIVLTESRDMNPGATQYVSRLYINFLDRNADTMGLNDWTQKILNDIEAAKTIPFGFILSPEFLGRNISDEDFVKMCYRTILDREYDQDGLADWVDRLTKGVSRKDVCAGFTYSVEFKKLLAQYGL